MHLSETLKGLLKAATVGMLLACMLFVPFTTVPVSAEGGSNGQPHDSTGKSFVGDEGQTTSSEDVVLVEALKLTTLITLMTR
jgi:hypothetical protein